MDMFKDIISIIDNVSGVILRPVKIVTEKIADEVEEISKDIFGD